MSKLYLKAMIEDVRADRCSDDEISYLLDHYEVIIKKEVGMARTAIFDMADFPLARKYDIHHFRLQVDRKMVLDQEQFWGVFTHGDKKLTVIGTLEEV